MSNLKSISSPPTFNLLYQAFPSTVLSCNSPTKSSVSTNPSFLTSRAQFSKGTDDVDTVCTFPVCWVHFLAIWFLPSQTKHVFLNAGHCLKPCLQPHFEQLKLDPSAFDQAISSLESVETVKFALVGWPLTFFSWVSVTSAERQWDNAFSSVNLSTSMRSNWLWTFASRIPISLTILDSVYSV